MPSLPRIRKKILFPLLSIIVLFLSVWTGVVLVQQQEGLRTQAAPANPNTSLDTRKVLNYLGCLPRRSENRVISGHFIRAAERAPAGYRDFVVRLHSQTGKWVAMIGSDYTKTAARAIVTSPVNRVLIDYWNNGGLVTMSWSAGNPWGGNVRDNKDRVNIDQLLAPGTSVNNVWMNWLDTVAAGLAELQDAGVVVLWRPFHEMNGGWFWWAWDNGERTSPGQYTRLWRHMFDYFTNTKGLNNMLWIYSPDGQESDPPPSWERPVMHYYPGDEYVDIVAWDVYDDQLLEYGYDDLLATGKPIMFGEQGPGRTRNGTWDNTILIKSIKKRYPKITAFQAWSSWPGSTISLVENQNAAKLLNDPWVITREEVNWREVDSSCSLASPTPTPTLTKSPTPTPTKAPTKTPTPTSPTPPSSGNLITNPSFEDGTQNWSFLTDGSGTFTTNSPAYEGASAAKVSITTQGSNVQLYQKGISLEPNTQYKLSFAAFSNTGHDLEVKLHKHGAPYINYGLDTTVNLGKTWKTFNLDFVTNDLGGASVADGRLRFWLAPYEAVGDVYWIDNVVLAKAGAAPPPPTTLSGDIDKDGDVDIFDYNLLIENFGNTSCGNVADIDGNCKVDIFDYNILIENFGKRG